MRDLQEYRKIHFIGIGGISVSALAKLMLSLGKEVSGSDAVFSPTVLSLMEAGVRVWIGSEPCMIDAELAVYSSAVPLTDPEVAYCKLLGMPVYERNEFLQIVASSFKSVIAIAGTHGKTTTTAMLAALLKKAGYGFCAHIGGDAVDMGNLYCSGEDFFITEACEYKRSLLKLKPDIAVVLNAEKDHPDTYSTVKELYDTFNAFLFSNPKCMPLVYRDCEYFDSCMLARDNVLTFGIKPESTFAIGEIREYKPGYYSFAIDYLGVPFSEIRLPIPGLHNVYNAAAAVAVACLLHIPSDTVVSGLESFKGVKRRFEKRGMLGRASVYHDYAHHPSEIKASIALARRITRGRLIAVFQPHTYSRTKQLFDEFSTCFYGCDDLYIVKEYAAREDKSQGLDAYTLYKNIVHEGCRYYKDTISLAKRLVQDAGDGDTVLVMGAGDIDSLCDLIVGS